MRIEFLNKKTNPALPREEMDFVIKNTKTTPSIKDLRNGIALENKSKPELTLVLIVKHVFGSDTVKGKARIYKEEQLMKSIESKYVLEKNFGKPKEKKEEVKEEAVQEKQEEKKIEAKTEKVLEEKKSEIPKEEKAEAK